MTNVSSEEPPSDKGEVEYGGPDQDSGHARYELKFRVSAGALSGRIKMEGPSTLVLLAIVVTAILAAGLLWNLAGPVIGATTLFAILGVTVYFLRHLFRKSD